MTHTTNDAPVTVECYAEAEAMLADIMCRVRISDTAIRVARDHMMQFARHRLAALASAPAEQLLQKMQKFAPAGDGVEIEDAAWAWMDGKWEVPADRDYSADEMVDAFIAGHEAALARPHSAVAPAGDGVEEARAIILQHSEKWVAEYVEREGELPDTMMFRFPFVERLLAAALARPRVAVEERE